MDTAMASISVMRVMVEIFEYKCVILPSLCSGD